MRLFLSLIGIAAALQESPLQDDSLSLLQRKKHSENLEDEDSSPHDRRAASHTPQPRVNHTSASLGSSHEHSALIEYKEKSGATRNVRIGNSNSNNRCVNVPVPVACNANSGDRGIRVNGHNANDRFDISSNGNRVCARRLDSNGGWGMQLEVSCQEIVTGPVNVRIDNSGSNTKCVNAPVPVTCNANSGDRGIRVNNPNDYSDRFEITSNGNGVCARRLDSNGGWGMHLEVACREAVPPGQVQVLIDNSGSNTRCVTADEPVVCATNAGNLGNRINMHRAGDTFDITVTGGNRVCARRTDSNGGWGMHLRIQCTQPPPPQVVNVRVDSSGTNNKCVTAPVPVTCATNAGDLGNRVNGHGAADTFDITTNGDRVCAMRTDSNGGWGMRLEISCTEIVPPASVHVLIDASPGSTNTRCVDAGQELVCAANAGHLGNRINSHGAADTFDITTSGTQGLWPCGLDPVVLTPNASPLQLWL